jgi:hypothetical protein
MSDAAAVLRRWHKRINVEATVTVAWLSFLAIPPSLQAIFAKDFIVTFGTAYLFHYGLVAGATRQQLHDDLVRQIAEVNLRENRFANLDSDKLSIERSGWNPRLLWALYADHSLARVACVLLSLSASEAAVERTFSAQAAVHTKKRNRLSNPIVQAEMFLKFNNRMMRGKPDEQEERGVVELDEEYEVDDCATTVVEEPLSLDDPFEDLSLPLPEQKENGGGAAVPMNDVDSDDDFEPAAAAAAAAVPDSASIRRRARREASVIFPSSDAFIRWFIEEHRITASTKWNGDLRGSLERFAISRFPPPCPHTQKLEQLIRAALEVPLAQTGDQ